MIEMWQLQRFLCLIQTAMLRELTFKKTTRSLFVVWMLLPRFFLTSLLLQPFFHVYTYKRYATEFSKTFIIEKQGYLLPLHSHEKVDCFIHKWFKKISTFPSSNLLFQPYLYELHDASWFTRVEHIKMNYYILHPCCWKSNWYCFSWLRNKPLSWVTPEVLFPSNW